MRLFLIKIGWFSVLCSGVYLMLLFAVGTFAPQSFKPNLKYTKGTYGYTNTRLQDIKKQSNLDVLVVGSSHAYRGFDPRVFKANGYQMFNLGSSAQTPTQTLLLLKRYLKNKKVGTLLYEVYPTTFSIDGVESSLDIIANDQNDMLSFAMACQMKHAKVANTLVYAYMDQLLHPVAISEPKHKKEDTYVEGGYVQRIQGTYTANHLPKNTLKIDPKQWAAFQEIIQLVKQKKIRLLLVFAPVTKALYQSYTNLPYFENKIKAQGEYYNFNGRVALEDHLHFYDSNHLNQAGVTLFNAKVMQQLFPPRTIAQPEKNKK